ncbi:DNA-binding protein [Anaerovorax odorimutans]|uniref:DNA-binding protein n=1 Tax=Anaerovorax odorimutans TaxID=109327 RepID=A0ABT1RS14_9FIRM|nr:DNA-binding protein [Anaerovorax odorimutans]MCQ4638002.1 DNA-binding protein [Anaerovorax odorimutans]
MQRIRTIDQAYDEIKQKDPDTAISRYLVRQMIKQGMVPSIKTGNKYLVDVDVLEQRIEELTGGSA